MWPKNTIKGTESSHTALIFPPKTIQNVIFGFLVVGQLADGKMHGETPAAHFWISS